MHDGKTDMMSLHLQAIWIFAISASLAKLPSLSISIHISKCSSNFGEVPPFSPTFVQRNALPILTSSPRESQIHLVVLDSGGVGVAALPVPLAASKLAGWGPKSPMRYGFLRGYHGDSWGSKGIYIYINNRYNIYIYNMIYIYISYYIYIYTYVLKYETRFVPS